MRTLAALLSIAVAGVGVWWWTSPASYPFGARDRVTVSLSHLFEHGVAGMMMVAAGVVGVAAVLLRNRWLVAAQVLFFGVVMSDAGIISAMGYLFGLGAPLALAGSLVIMCVRGQRAGFIALGVTAALTAAGVAAGLLTGEVIQTYVTSLTTSFSSYGVRIAWTIANAAAFIVWLVIAIRPFVSRSGAWASDAGWTRPEAAARWGRIVTIAAALCPLPYGLYRLTWLTPWPVQDLQGGSLTMAMRLQGSVIAVSALIAAVLTLGLISKWGEVFPRWIPILGGRPVPVGFPVIAGGLMAGLFFLAGTGMVINAIERDTLSALLLFPYPLWAVLLGAAVFAYWLRRRPVPALAAA
ncbi:hypothetical protein ACTMTF_42425 [Nonomuraea sp. ZG12]|uniref:hypothetical protein n=1 Tax=Nonomuraea sp. ZG12 TaxID=3452207 RepID=UPI003F8B8DB0